MQDPAHRPNQNHSSRGQNYKSLSFFNVFHPNKYIFSLFLVWLCLLARAGAVQAQQKLDLSIASVRSAYAEQLAEQDQMAKEHAWAVARKQGWSPKKQVGNVLYELMAIRDGRVYMNITNNKNAAISTATDLVRNTAPYNLNGSGLTVGIWDGGAVLSTH